MADITSLLSTGDSAQRIDLVFVAEGYQSSERAKFLADAARFLDYMLSPDNARLNDPFAAYRNYFNASALFVASAQSGMDKPGISVDTYFDSAQHLSDGRLVYGDEAKVTRVVSESLASNAHELTVVLVNSTDYGGAGGTNSWATSGNLNSAEVVLHEIGHSFASLEDEYVDTAIVGSYPLSGLSSAHLTSSLSTIPWAAWLGYTDTLGTVGTYEGGYYRATGVWRATLDSKMFHLGVPFSAPEKEAFVLSYYRRIGDYLSVSSDIPGLYSAIVPDADMLAYSWSLNGSTISNADNAYLDVYGRGAYATSTALSLTTSDSTGYVRTGLAQTQQTEQVTLNNRTVTDIAEQTYAITQSHGIYRFGALGNVISIGAGTGSDYIDGGAGVDTLVFTGLAASYEVSKLSTGTTLFAQQGVAVLAAANVELARFADQTIRLTADAPLTTGTSGNDTLSGAAGNDTLDGGAGTDIALFTSNLANYTLTRSGTTYTARANTGTDGTDILTNVESLRFADKTVNLTVQALAAAASQADVQRLAELYVAFFNRVPDADGLAYWIGQMGAGQGTSQIAEAFYNAGVQYSSLTGFSAGMSNGDFVNVIYHNVLGRGEGADAGGLAYWSGELVSGRATHGSLVSTILSSAHTFKGDPTWGWVADLLDNKITVAKTFAVDWGLNYNSAADSITQGMAIAAAVTPTSTAEAIALIGISASDMHLV